MVDHTTREADANPIRFRRIFDDAPIALVSTDRAGLIQEANHAAMALFRLRYERLVGTPLQLLVIATDRDAVGRALDLASARRLTEFVVTLAQARRTRCQVALCAAVPPASDPASAMVHWTARDVTMVERTKTTLEEQLAMERAAGRQLRAVGELRRTLLTTVAHDLRSPIAALLLQAEVLRSCRKLDGVQRADLVEQVHRTATDLSALVTDILELARAERGVMPIDRAVVGLDAVVTQAADKAIATAAGAGPEVELDVRPVVARVDPRVIERIVSNLVTHALEHAREYGHVWIRLTDAPEGVLLIVEDDGPGMTDHAKEHIFDPFGRGAGSRGFGLGLGLVRQFAALHGGTARVADRPGGGTSFQVLIPDQPLY